jgi:hypothetical protein
MMLLLSPISTDGSIDMFGGDVHVVSVGVY